VPPVLPFAPVRRGIDLQNEIAAIGKLAALSVFPRLLNRFVDLVLSKPTGLCFVAAGMRAFAKLFKLGLYRRVFGLPLGEFCLEFHNGFSVGRGHEKGSY